METGELSICSRWQFQQQNVQSFCSSWRFALAFPLFVVSCFAVMEIKFQPIMCCIMQRMGFVHWKMVGNKKKILVTWRAVQANSTRSDRLLNSSKIVFTLKSTDWKKNEKWRLQLFYSTRKALANQTCRRWLNIPQNQITRHLFHSRVSMKMQIGLYMFSLKVSTIKFYFFVLVSALLSCLFS